MDEWLNILIEFLATFIGVFLAFGLTFWYDRRHKTLELREVKIRILEAIISEYKFALDILSQRTDKPTTVRLSTLAVDSAVGSGDLSLLEPKIQSALSLTDFAIRNGEMFTDKIVSMIGSADLAMTKGGPTELANYVRRLKETQDVLREKLPIVVKTLEDEVTRLKKKRGFR